MTTDRYFHYSAKPLRRIRPTPVQPAPGEFIDGVGPGKPAGLWFSVGGGWAEWCRGNDHHVEMLARRTELLLDAGRVLVVAGHAALMDFDREWSVDAPGGMSTCRIDWRAVAGRWGGIVIAPYDWTARMELLWYYGWDCASGCVWDAGCVRVGGAAGRRQVPAP